MAFLKYFRPEDETPILVTVFLVVTLANQRVVKAILVVSIATTIQ